MRRGALLVALGAVLWGTGGVTGAALAQAGGWSALAVATTRLLAGAVVLGALLLATRPPAWWRERTAVRRVVVVGVLLALYQGFYFASVVTWGVARATLVALGGAPLLVAVARVLRHRTAPDLATAVSVVLGVGGLTLLVVPALLGGASSISGAGGDVVSVGRGALLAAAAAATFATVTVVNRRAVRGLSPVTMTAASFAVGGALLAPVALAVGWTTRATAHGAVAPTARPLVVAGLVLLLGSIPTAAAWAAYFSGLPFVTAQRATVLALLEPLTATLAAALVLGERLGAPALAGGGLLLVATVLAARGTAPPGE